MKKSFFFSQLVLLLILVITAISPVSAKVASGLQTLSGGLHQGQTPVESLLRLGSSDISRIVAVGSSLVTKGVAKIDPNKVSHIFGQSKHNLDGVVKTFGPPEKAFGALQDATQAAVKNQGIKGVFETAVKVGGETVTVRGNVVDGVVKLGTAFK